MKLEIEYIFASFMQMYQSFSIVLWYPSHLANNSKINVSVFELKNDFYCFQHFKDFNDLYHRVVITWYGSMISKWRVKSCTVHVDCSKNNVYRQAGVRMESTVGLGGILMHVCAGGRERGRKSKGAELTGFLQITGSLTAVESNGAGRAESITGHNRFSHRSELGKAVLYCSADSWHRASTGKGACSQKKKRKKQHFFLINLWHTINWLFFFVFLCSV